MEPLIRPVVPADAEVLAAIYNHYITETVITFEEVPLGVAEMERRIADIASRFPWFVAAEEGRVVGYCYGNLFRPRASYRFSSETTFYLAPDALGRGLGSRFCALLLPALKECGFHAALAGITLPNPASIRLHEKFGFGKVAHLREVGYKFGQWLDVGYWELILK